MSHVSSTVNGALYIFPCVHVCPMHLLILDADEDRDEDVLLSLPRRIMRLSCRGKKKNVASGPFVNTIGSTPC